VSLLDGCAAKIYIDKGMALFVFVEAPAFKGCLESSKNITTS
jgi:hypothetical protein